MKMKKQLIAVLLVLCGMTVRADDEYLYWMIDYNAKIEGKWGIESKVADGAYYARVGYAGAGKTVEQIVAGGTGLDGYLGLYETPSSSTVITDLSGKEGSISTAVGSSGSFGVLVAPVYAKLLGETGGTYWVELLNESGDIVGYNSMGTYAALSEYISKMELDPSQAFVAVGPFVVPEPNSALLLMLGCAALALRRRRKIAA